MSRPVRLVIVIAALAIAGIVGLSLIARKYAAVVPLRSVAEEVAAAPVPDGATTPQATRERLEAFVAGRQAVRSLIESRPAVFRELLDEAQGRVGDRDRVRMHNFILVQLRGERTAAAQELGLDETQYRAVREEYRKWRSGGSTADPAWKALFEANPDLAAVADLGEWDVLDF